MAQRGWITKQQRKKNGSVWVYHWYLLKPETGKKVEHSPAILGDQFGPGAASVPHIHLQQGQ